jgi:bifunctional non-homologous end joining protein LigD
MLHVRLGRPDGHISPCLPSRAERPPAGPKWLHEIKHDGFRIMARRNGDGVRLYTRNGYDFAGRFPQIVAAMSKLRARSCLIDGEAIVVDEHGLSTFDLLRSWRHDRAAVLCAFDLIELDGRDLRTAPIEQRKQACLNAIGRAVTVRRDAAGKTLELPCQLFDKGRFPNGASLPLAGY